MTKRLKVLIIIFFAVAAIATGTIFYLSRSGKLASSAAVLNPKPSPTATPIPDSCKGSAWVHGRVINSKTNKPLPAATVWARTTDCNGKDGADTPAYTTKKTTADSSGYYELHVPISQLQAPATYDFYATKTIGGGGCEFSGNARGTALMELKLDITGEIFGPAQCSN